MKTKITSHDKQGNVIEEEYDGLDMQFTIHDDNGNVNRKIKLKYYEEQRYYDFIERDKDDSIVRHIKYHLDKIGDVKDVEVVK